MNQYEKIKEFLIKNNVKFEESKLQEIYFLKISYGLGNYYSIFRQNKKNKKTQYRKYFMTSDFKYKKRKMTYSKFMYCIKNDIKTKKLR